MRPHITALASLTLLSGCLVGPDYEPPEIDLPQTWQNGEALPPEESEDLSRWWTTLDDEVLDQLVDRAIESNLDLQQAMLRIDAVRAGLGVSASELYPQLQADGSALWNYSGRRAFGFGAFQRRLETYNAAVGGSWEFDVFGRIRRGIESAEAEIGASLEDYRGLVVAIVAEVGRNYVLVRSFEERVAIAEENLANQVETLELTRARANGGLAPDLDVARSETNVETTRASIPVLRQGLLEARNRLSVLLGSRPGEIDELLGPAATLPTSQAALGLDMPLTAILRRPDVRRAERFMAAQSAQIGIAESERYPRFFAVSSVGVASSNVNVLDSRSLQFFAGPSISWNLFTGGRIDSNVAAQEAIFEERTQAFEQSILLALEEIENALGGVRNERERVLALQSAVEAARRARDQSRSLYVGGLSDFDAVLSAEQLRLQTEDALAVGRTNVLLELIDLYAALGGGWNDREATEDEESDGVPAFGEPAGSD